VCVKTSWEAAASAVLAARAGQEAEPKPEPSTFTAHGKTWTPAVGDLVQLKSGGPLMTIERVISGTADVAWINNHGDVKTANLCITSLTPAKKEQP
jgi:uncharacterized protein YodC (DUF2158 family)